MKSLLLWSVLLTLCLTLTSPITTAAQESAAISTSHVVPSLINYNGVLKDSSGRTLMNLTGVTFLLYKDEQGGAPLWMETQNIQPDKAGHYTIQLGAASKNGIPPDLFMNGEARWLAVQIGSEPEQPRILLVAVPYAMKAVDAQTLGGLPASAFVLAAPPSGVTAPAAAAANNTANTSTLPPPSSAVTTSGAAADVGAIPFFSTATDIEKSILTQTGTTAINVNGTLNLPAKGTASSAAGFASQRQQFTASVFSTSTNTPVAQTFFWQAEPVNNDKTTATGTLNLLYALGAGVPAETGLKINSKGQFTFAAGQTFPGTIAGVTAGTDLTGGGTSGKVTLNVDTTKVVTGVVAGSDLTGGGTGGVQTLNLDTTKVPLLAAKQHVHWQSNGKREPERNGCCDREQLPDRKQPVQLRLLCKRKRIPRLCGKQQHDGHKQYCKWFPGALLQHRQL